MDKKSPQQKKKLSYAKDRRNTYGENSKSSRKNIPLNKRLDSRANRHLAKQALVDDVAKGETEQPREAEARQAGKRHRFWKKWPDTPLGEVVEGKLERRLPKAEAKPRIEKVRQRRKR